jgi:hypothetical protein
MSRSLFTLNNSSLEKQDALFDGPVKGYVKVHSNKYLFVLEDGHRRKSKYLVGQGGDNTAEQEIQALKQRRVDFPLAPDPPWLPSPHARGAEGTHVGRRLCGSIDDVIQDAAPVTHTDPFPLPRFLLDGNKMSFSLSIAPDQKLVRF